MLSDLELLRRIDEKDYLTEREHRQYLDELRKNIITANTLKGMIGFKKSWNTQGHRYLPFIRQDVILTEDTMLAVKDYVEK